MLLTDQKRENRLNSPKSMRSSFCPILGFLKFAEMPTFRVFSQVFEVSEMFSRRSEKATFDNIHFCFSWWGGQKFFCCKEKKAIVLQFYRVLGVFSP